MAWTFISSVLLRLDWQFTDPVDGEFFRITHSGAPNNGLFALAQVEFSPNVSVSIFGAQVFEVSSIPEVIYLKKPECFSERAIALRRVPQPLSLKAELRTVLRTTLFKPSNSEVRTQRYLNWNIAIESSDYIG